MVVFAVEKSKRCLGTSLPRKSLGRLVPKKCLGIFLNEVKHETNIVSRSQTETKTNIVQISHSETSFAIISTQAMQYLVYPLELV